MITMMTSYDEDRYNDCMMIVKWWQDDCDEDKMINNSKVLYSFLYPTFN
jgi:hypothetical protein